MVVYDLAAVSPKILDEYHRLSKEINQQLSIAEHTPFKKYIAADYRPQQF